MARHPEMAQKALEAYAEAAGYRVEDERESAFSDLLADMMHLADDHGIDWDGLILVADVNYAAEIAEREQEDDTCHCGHPDCGAC